MVNDLTYLLNKLNDSVCNEDFIDVSYEITEQIGNLSNAFDSVEPILKLMENNPDVDFGVPGPLVHFLETFFGKGYEKKLVESLERRPTKHTVWMLNRIINSSEGNIKKYFIGVLENVLISPLLDQETESLAKRFKSLLSEE